MTKKLLKKKLDQYLYESIMQVNVVRTELTAANQINGAKENYLSRPRGNTTHLRG